MSCTRTLLAAAALSALAFGCGEVVKSDEDAAPSYDAAPSVDGSGDTCTGNLVDCNGTCVDTDTNHDYCGSCDNACNADEVCSGGQCATTCDTGLDACDGSCVDTDTSRDHCGVCGNDCAVDQACVAGTCEQLSNTAVPAFESTPPPKTGWTLYPNATPLSFAFVDVDLPEATYECRTGPEAMIGALSFARCDGADGTSPIHQPSPDGGVPEGSYRTEMRIRVGTWISGVIGYDYYVHNSLNNAEPCAAPDPAAMFNAASLAKTGAFDGTTEVVKPYVHLPFTNILITPGMRFNGYLNTAGTNRTIDLLSLRRRFVLSPDRQHLLIQRVWESRLARIKANRHTCGNNFYFGNRNNTTPSQRKIDCANMIMNRRGQVQCLDDSGNSLLTSNIGWLKLEKKYDDRNFSPKARTAGGCSGTWFNEECIVIPD